MIDRVVYEIHVTIEPVNPDDKVIREFNEVCVAHKMKPIYVGVAYTTGFKRFLQSSKYIIGTYAEADLTAWTCEKILADKFIIARVKIEAVAKSLEKIYYEKLPSNYYFENHTVISLKENYLPDGVFTMTDELKIIEGVNKQSYATMGRPLKIPLSFNAKHPNQCFITVRSYDCGYLENNYRVKNTLDHLERRGYDESRLIKVIREVVCDDTNPWVDAERLTP